MSDSTRLEENGMVPGENPIVPNADPAPEKDYRFGQMVRENTHQDRQGTLEKLFSSYRAAKAQTAAQVKGQTSEAARGFESSSALLQKNAEHAPRAASLTDRIRGLLGRT